MKVLIFNDTYESLSGAESYFHLLSGQLRMRGHVVVTAGFGDIHVRDSREYIYKETKVHFFRYF